MDLIPPKLLTLSLPKMTTPEPVKFTIKMIITETYPDLTFNNYEEFEEWCAEWGVMCSRKRFNKLAGKTIQLPTRRNVTHEHEEWIHHAQVEEYLLKKKIVWKEEEED